MHGKTKILNAKKIFKRDFSGDLKLLKCILVYSEPVVTYLQHFQDRKPKHKKVNFSYLKGVMSLHIDKIK